MKYLGIDFGSKKVGLAVSDQEGNIAFPKKVIHNSKSLEDEILSIAKEEGIQAIVFGESKNYKGEDNPIQKEIEVLTKAIESKSNIKLFSHPEFLTTQEAKRTQKDYKDIDSRAASIMLQNFLDTQHNNAGTKNISQKGSMKERVRNWAESKAGSKASAFWLAVLSVSDSFFFIIPPDVLLVPVLAIKPKKWIYFSTITFVSSIVGGLIGYAVGIFGYEIIGEPLIQFYGLEEEFALLGERFSDSAFLAIFAGAFTPLPYKVFTISAGFFSVNLLIFILASVLGRGIRYFAIGYIMNRVGDRARFIIHTYFNRLALPIAIIALVALVLYFLLGI